MSTFVQHGAANLTGRAASAPPSILLSHPTGNQNVRNAVRALAERDMLAEFWTTIAWNRDSAINALFPGRVKTQLQRRSFPFVPGDKIRCAPSREVMRLMLSNAPVARLLCADERPFSVIGMYRHFDAAVARRLSSVKPDAVYAYEGGALNTFRRAKELGVRTTYELPSGYWYRENEIFAEDVRRSPEFATLHPGLSDSAKHLQWKDEELALADIVVVPSQFVRTTLRGVIADEKIRVLGYGAPPPRPRPKSEQAEKPLRVLFVGSLIQRKGLGYLLQAVRELGTKVQFTLVGHRFADNEAVDRARNQYAWFETLPHAEVLEVMKRSDVLVLPSLSDAFGLVVTEALSCGLPVIVTPNVGASDLIRDGVNGFVVPVGSAQEITSCLERLCSDRNLLSEMSHEAQETAAANSWETYRQKWADLVRDVSCR